MSQIGPHKIFLIGMPGSGKSTIGEALANALNLPFYDLDQLIETVTHSTISSILDDIGETRFREIEMNILFSFIKNHNHSYIMATGGGSVINELSLNLINETGISVYLKCKVNTLMARLINNTISRPLLRQNKLEEDITNLLQIRKAYYQKAQITHPADGPIDEIINELVNKL